MENTLGHGQRRERRNLDSQWLLPGLAVVVMAILAATLFARLTGYQPDSTPVANIVELRELGFRDLPRGVVEVYEWHSNAPITRIQAGDGSFIRGVVRSLVRQRRGLSAEAGARFELARYSDGRLVLSDPQTTESIDLIAFGPSNVAAFAQLLDAPLPQEPAGPPDTSW